MGLSLWLMAYDKAVRWMPVEGLPELPLGGLDLSYDASEKRLTVRAFYSDLSAVGLPKADGVALTFDDVEAFKAYEEFTDPMDAAKLDVPLLAQPVPYGGTWGFIQILCSSWLERLAARNGAWSATSAAHWVVKTGDMVLHVATQRTSSPIFNGRLERA